MKGAFGSVVLIIRVFMILPVPDEVILGEGGLEEWGNMFMD